MFNRLRQAASDVAQRVSQRASDVSSVILYDKGPPEVQVQRRWEALCTVRDAIVGAKLSLEGEREKLRKSPMGDHLKRIVALLEAEDHAARKKRAQRELRGDDDDVTRGVHVSGADNYFVKPSDC